MAGIPASAQALIDRIAAVDYEQPAAPDRDVIATAFAAHLKALEQPDRPIRWFDDAGSAYRYVHEEAVKAARAAQRRGAAWGAARDAAWGAAWGAAFQQARAVWLPFVDAFCAGLFIFWVRPTEVVAVPRPAIRIEDGRVHCGDGPAVEWPSGERYYFWRGLQLSEDAADLVVVHPEKLGPERILREPNIEIRRVMIERFGAERLMRERGAKTLSVDDFGRLWMLEVPDDEPIVMVEVMNSTPEPDGSSRDYFLRVPPTITTPLAAVAWTFDVKPEDYRSGLVTQT